MKKLNLKRMLNFRSFALAGLIAFTVFAVSCDKENDEYFPAETYAAQDSELKAGKAVRKGDMTILEAVVANDDFSILKDIVVQVATAKPDAGLLEVLGGTDQYTVFAPNNDAFNALIEYLTNAGRTDLLSNNDYLLDVLLFHVTEGRRAANSVVPPQNPRMIETALGQPFWVDTTAKIWTDLSAVPVSTIVGPNMSASNGIIHEINAVLIPYVPAQ